MLNNTIDTNVGQGFREFKNRPSYALNRIVMFNMFVLCTCGPFTEVFKRTCQVSCKINLLKTNLFVHALKHNNLKNILDIKPRDDNRITNDKERLDNARHKTIKKRWYALYKKQYKIRLGELKNKGVLTYGFIW